MNNNYDNWTAAEKRCYELGLADAAKDSQKEFDREDMVRAFDAGSTDSYFFNVWLRKYLIEKA